jgi:hypothetical protein
VGNETEHIIRGWVESRPIVPKYEIIIDGVWAIVDYDPNPYQHPMYKPEFPIDYKWRWQTWFGSAFKTSRGDGHGRAETPDEAKRQAEAWIKMFLSEVVD